MSARDRILAKVRTALEGRSPIEHPGPFGAWRPDAAPTERGSAETIQTFVQRLEAAGGEVVRCRNDGDASAWIAEFATAFGSASMGVTVSEAFRPRLPTAEAADAEFGISIARGAVAETGSLLMDARDGRRQQLLPPTHIVLIREEDVFALLRDALEEVRADLPSAIGLHSGPSKSADIGQILVKGVHGPGRLVAILVGAK